MDWKNFVRFFQHADPSGGNCQPNEVEETLQDDFKEIKK